MARAKCVLQIPNWVLSSGGIWTVWPPLFVRIRVSILCLVYWIYLAPARTSSRQKYNEDKACSKSPLIFPLATSPWRRVVYPTSSGWGMYWFIACHSSFWPQYALFNYLLSHLCSPHKFWNIPFTLPFISAYPTKFHFPRVTKANVIN